MRSGCVPVVGTWADHCHNTLQTTMSAAVTLLVQTARVLELCVRIARSAASCRDRTDSRSQRQRSSASDPTINNMVAPWRSGCGKLESFWSRAASILENGLTRTAITLSSCSKAVAVQ